MVDITRKLDPAAVIKLRQSVLDSVAQYAPFVYTNVVSPNREYVEARLNAILADNRIDPIEAPWYFRGTTMLQDDEVLGHREAVINTLQEAKEYLDHYIAIAGELSKELHESELSFFNYSSLENAFGLADNMYHRTRSSVRLNGAVQVLSELQDMRFGVDVLIDSIKIGYFPEDNAFVQKFLQSPFAAVVNLNRLIFVYDEKDYPKQIFVSELVKLADDHKIEELGVRFFNQSKTLLTDKGIDELHPDLWTYAYEMAGRRVINSTINLPQLAATVIGIGIGSLIAKGAAARGIVAGAMTSLGPAKYALPGVTFFRMGGEAPYMSRFLRIPLNLAFETTKATIYIGAGKAIGNQSGEDVAGLLYMGGVGTYTGYTRQIIKIMTSEIIAGKTDGLVGHWIENGMDLDDSQYVAERTALWRDTHSFRVSTLRYFQEQLQAITNIKIQIKLEADAALRTAQEAVELERLLLPAQKRLAKLLTRIEVLAQKLSSGDAQQLLEDARRIASIADPNQEAAAKAGLNTLINDATTNLREAAAARRLPAVTTPPTPKRPIIHIHVPSRPSPIYDVGPRAARLAEYTPGQTPTGGTQAITSDTARPEDIATSAQETSLVDQILSHPPTTLDEATIQGLTQGSVSFFNGAQQDLQNLYAKNPRLRSAIIKRLEELPRVYRDRLLDGKNWKMLEGVDNRIRGKLGNHYRLLAERIENELKIYGIRSREALGSGKAWK